VKFYPAFYGGIISALFYFLGKVLFNRMGGFYFGFFGALVPAFIYRQMAGFFEEDSFGFIFLLSGFIFLVKALKKKSWKASVVSGILFGLMAWSWSMYLLEILFVVFGSLIVVLGIVLEGDKSILWNLKYVLLSFLVFAIVAYPIVGFWWAKDAYDAVARYAPITKENFYRAQGKDAQGRPIALVGEESPGFKYFGTKYGALIVLPVFALILLAYLLYVDFKANYVLVYLLTLIAITFYMGWTKLKFTYIFGLGVALSGGVAFYYAINFFKNQANKIYKYVGFFVILFFIFTTVSAASLFVQNHSPSIEQRPEWKRTLQWARTNMPKDAYFFNWWNEGHWITFLAERKVLTDNTNADQNANGAFSYFALTRDLNEAYNTIKTFGSNYLIAGKEYLMGANSFVIYANRYSLANKKGKQFSYVYFANVIPCSMGEERGKIYYSCGGAKIEKTQFETLPTTWTKRPNWK